MKRRIRIIEFLVLLMVAMGAGPVGAAIWQWSTTAGTNATADPTINWSEGMSPSSVNDSARAMMAAIAGWRNDISGVNTTGGSSTAYTLTTSEGVDTTPANGQMVAFIAHATNGVSPTLTVDGGNTYPIWLNGAAAGAATLVASTPYRVSFSVANSAWLLESGFGNPYNIPLGGYLFSSVATAPNSNFVLADGSCVSRTTYAAYFAQVSTIYGACDGVTTFGVPDTRGRAMINLDGGAGRLTNAVNGCGVTFNSLAITCGNESQTLGLTQLPTGITSSGSNTVSVSAVGGQALPTGQISGGLASGTAPSTTPGGNNYPFAGSGTVWSYTSSLSAANTINVTSNNTGGLPHPNVQPSYGVKVFVRIF